VTALKGDTEGSEGRRSRLTQTLVVVQMALSLVLLVGAGLFLRNLQDATSVDTGFASGNLLLAATDPGLQGYDRERADVFYRELVPRVRSLPGVRAAALAEMVPLGLSSQQYGITVPGYVPAANERMNIDYNIVGPGYFETMDIPLRGRGFLDRDSETSRRVIVVNERMARRFWPGEDAIGRVVELGGYPREVVGVAADGKYGTLGEDPLAFMYLPQAQQYSYAMTFHVRTDGDPLSVLPAIREAVAQLDPNLPVYDVRSMEQHLGLSLLPARLAGTVLGIFGGLGLVLAAVGIYGVMAQAVSRRRREIGLRLALGARRDEVVGMVLRQGFMLALLGVSIALPVAFAASRLIRGLLYSNSTIDPFTYLSVPAILLGVALVATYLPARRAAAIEPMQALKSD
jgi:predicted permease